ncbi:MAG: hypothetical protein KZQ77_01565, partial [Candidatus Thiodiazotropha sp. (ex Notomyrtea botanica)]|nr:hypothetical protein [Candidatus Thiodiazotropha sp. (ex Notomyrtea botanica)]
MGLQHEKDHPVFPNLCIYLLEKDQERQKYLKQVLAFVDGEILSIDGPEKVIEQVGASQNGCIAVLLGSGFQGNERENLLKQLADENPAIPVFQIFDDAEGIPEKAEGFPNVIGNLKLPTHYDDLMALAH